MIMTSSEEKKNYEKLSLSADVVESHLPSILVEGGTAESGVFLTCYVNYVFVVIMITIHY